MLRNRCNISTRCRSLGYGSILKIGINILTCLSWAAHATASADAVLCALWRHTVGDENWNVFGFDHNLKMLLFYRLFVVLLLLLLHPASPQQHHSPFCSVILSSITSTPTPSTADLHQAARDNDVATTCVLLSAGADPNVKGM